MFSNQYNFFEDENFYIKKLCHDYTNKINQEKIISLLKNSVSILYDKNKIKDAEANSIRLAYLLNGNEDAINYIKENLDNSNNIDFFKTISDNILQIIRDYERI
ncbi:MAG: hypothetical protein WC002_10145 [Candidatus Muiribacteriota bacterium]|jgi:hypothetical protein